MCSCAHVCFVGQPSHICVLFAAILAQALTPNLHIIRGTDSWSDRCPSKCPMHGSQDVCRICNKYPCHRVCSCGLYVCTGWFCDPTCGQCGVKYCKNCIQDHMRRFCLFRRWTCSTCGTRLYWAPTCPTCGDAIPVEE